MTAPVARRAARARPRVPRTGRRPRVHGRGLVFLCVLAFAGLAVAAFRAFSDGPARRDPPAITPLRVTSGTEIATGFAVGRDRVLTVAHVLGGALKVGRDEARVVRIDRRSDLALLAVPGVSGAAPDEARAGSGDDVHVVRLRGGRADPAPARVRRPIVAHVRTLAAKWPVARPALELAGRVLAGDSGAPVLSGSGALVGVIFATSSRREDTAYAVDAGAVTRLVAAE